MLKTRLRLLVVAVLLCHFVQAQYLMDMVDTTKEMGKSMLSMYNRYDNLKFIAYIQPQFQLAETKGELSYAGGNFAANSNSRFMLRRARLMADYSHFPKSGNAASYQFVFQVDATERGVNVRDVWGRVFENRYKMFAFTMGLFARPFGYEVNLSSAFRESPERGRMSQIIVNNERDVGAMLTFEPRTITNKLKFLRVNMGVFNGPGLSSTTDYDSHKDFISQVLIKPQKLGKKVTLGGSASIYLGGLSQNTQYIYNTEEVGAIKTYVVDSALSNLQEIAPRKYYGADMQLVINNKVGLTQIRGEFITGTQTASSTSSQTPGASFTGTQGYYIRNFNGAYFYFLQNLWSIKHQLGIKYDWYDPNTFVKKTEIGAAGSNLNAADVKYKTLGFGYLFYMNEHVKFVVWYDYVDNEVTTLPGYTANVKDNVLTFRLQFRF